MDMDYYHIPPEKLGEGARLPVVKFESSDAVFQAMAEEMCAILRENNAAGRRTVLICPVGPVGQYPWFVRQVNRERISLKDCWIINMDEYLTDSGDYLDISDPLSFRGHMAREVYGKIVPELLMAPEQRIFPDPANPGAVTELLERLGGADACFGGVGITGHLAFNEPQPELSLEAFASLTARVLDIAPETRAANAIGELGGAIEALPKKCVTVGMKEILSAKKLRLGVFRDWHRAVCRRAAYGEVTPAFPATLAQNHPDAALYVNDIAAALPY